MSQMSIDREDATRIIRFCLAGVGWGAATREDDAYVVKVTRSDDGKTDARRFEGASYEDALRCAAHAGSLNLQCLEKQMTFLARVLPSRGARADATVTDVPDSVSRGASGRAPPTSTPFSGLTQSISGFLDEAQRERGISALYLASAGRLYGSRLPAQWSITDPCLAGLRAARERHRGRIPAEAQLCLDRALETADKVAAGRGAIEALAVSAVDAIARYSTMNSELLAVIDALASRSIEPILRPTALAWMALLHAKEKTGIERAQLASAFACDRYGDGQYALISALIAASETYLHLFAAAAPAAAEQLLRRSLQSEVVAAVAGMERIAMRKQDGGFGVDPEDWFVTVSQKMDLFRDVESLMGASMAPPAPG